MKKWTAPFLFLCLVSCSSAPQKTNPEWTEQPARTVDNGYIVYIGKGEGFTPEKAQFRAEGVALEDLANECSFVPKGTRVEDRFVEKKGQTEVAYVKVAIEFAVCSEAQKTNDPALIREKANLAFAEQLQRYQDLEETGENVETKVGEVEPITEPYGPPVASSGVNSQTQFFMYRQYVAYEKQVVIMSPPTAYAPGSPETVHFGQAIATASPIVERYSMAHPELKTSPQVWSRTPDHPRFERPENLRAKAFHRRMERPSLRPPPRPQERAQARRGGGKPVGRKRKKYNGNYNNSN